MGCQASTPTAQKMRPLWQMLGRDLARPYPRVSMVPHTSLPSSQVSALEAPVSPPAPEPKEPPAGLPHPSLLSTSEIPTRIYSYHSNMSIAFSKCIRWSVIRCPRGTVQLPGTVSGGWVQRWPPSQGRTV